MIDSFLPFVVFSNKKGLTTMPDKKYPESKKDYNKQYNKDSYRQITIYVSKEYQAIVQNYVKINYLDDTSNSKFSGNNKPSVSALIKYLLNEEMKDFQPYKDYLQQKHDNASDNDQDGTQ